MAKYRLLNEGKKLKKYDEYYDFDNEQWRKVTLYRNQENVASHNDIYRRKIKKSKLKKGWRLLELGEMVKKGDEYYYPIGEGEWREVFKDDFGEIIDKIDYPHRRKMKKGKWRLLEPGEIIKKKDQFKRYGEWHRVYQYGVYVTGQLPYRRRRKK